MSQDLTELGALRAVARADLAGDAPAVARALLGTCLVRDEPRDRADGPTVVRIVETEAYREDDPASHTYRGRTDRNAVMFGPAGHAYVYFTYGMHFCANVSCGEDGEGAAVLVRAAVALTNHDLVRSRRPAAKRDRDLMNGPAKLTQALDVDRDHDGLDLLDAGSPLRLMTDGYTPDPDRVQHGPRVGVSAAADVPWRFWIDGVSGVSTYRRSSRA